MTDARGKADAELRAAVDAVTSARSVKRRAEAVAALRREADRELARIRHESRHWALRVTTEFVSRLATIARTGTDAALRDVLEVLAGQVGEVSDARFDSFTPTPHDLNAIRRAVKRGVGPPWVLSYLALRTGAFDQPRVAAPTTKQVATTREALRKTPRA